LIPLPVRPAVVALTARAAGWASEGIVQGCMQDLEKPDVWAPGQYSS